MEIIIGIIIGSVVVYFIMKLAIRRAVENTTKEMVEVFTKLEKAMTEKEKWYHQNQWKCQ